MSERAIDRCLEASLRVHHLEMARLCLASGADPNLGIWRLERSFNQQYSALGYAIAKIADSSLVAKFVECLLGAGADPSGIGYEGRNKPLFFALRKKKWEVAKLLLDGGAEFPSRGNRSGNSHRKSVSRSFGREAENLEWVEREIASLMSMAEDLEEDNFYEGHAQGGSKYRFLDAFFSSDDVFALRRFADRGLSLQLTARDIASALSSDAWDCLHYVWEKMGAPSEAMDLIIEREPKFGTIGREFLCRVEPDGSNVLADFDPHGQAPLELPDGTKFYAYLDGIAPPGHSHGAVPERHVYALTVEARFSRQDSEVVTHDLALNWELKPIPGTTSESLIVPCQLRRLLPVVKEIAGTYIWTGVTMHRLRHLKWPAELKDEVVAWSEGPIGDGILSLAESRIATQDQANVRTPSQILSDEELDGYPREYWPYLKRLDSGLIDFAEERANVEPAMRERYISWAEENKPDYESFVPDPRLMKWSLWELVPKELEPFFEIDSLLGVPGAKSQARNAYERVMIRKALLWNSGRMIRGLQEHLSKEEDVRSGSQDGKG